MRDSNPRRHCQLIYSQIPLATWVTRQTTCKNTSASQLYYQSCWSNELCGALSISAVVSNRSSDGSGHGLVEAAKATISSLLTTFTLSFPQGFPSLISSSSNRCHPDKLVNSRPFLATRFRTALGSVFSGVHRESSSSKSVSTVSIASDLVWPIKPTGPLFSPGLSKLDLFFV